MLDLSVFGSNLYRADEEVVRATQDAVTLSLASVEAVVAARESSRKSCDFKAADAIRDDLKAQCAQPEYVQQAPIAK